jgi:ABC-type glycerol-3-phosphate transport system substrate-binding protein
MNPNVKNITYRKLAVETYKDDLINAFASGKGPDIFLIRNSWRKAFEDKSAPAPSALISEQEYRNRLVDVAADDFINADKQIYGVPLSVDSLALYYNKDLFNVAGITRPPETWDEVAAYTRLLTSIDQFGSFTRSGIALGTGTNINRSSDILIALMMQYGAEFSTPGQGNQVSLS